MTILYQFAFILLISNITLFNLYGLEEQLSQTIKNFEKLAEEERLAWKVPGMAIAIIKGDDIILAKGYGQRGLTDTRPVDETTLFQIGSLSKAFTAALVAIAEDRKLLKWNDRVIDHLPSFHLYDPWATSAFQIVDLLSQRSGLPPYAGDKQAFLGYSSDAMIEHLKYLKPISSFRAEYAYQNIFFNVAAKILEMKMQATFPQLLKREIFKPLGMKNSSAGLEDYLNAKNRVEWLMRLDDGSTRQLKDDFPSNNWNYLLGAAGGINSNAIDMAKWLKFQANRGVAEQKQLISAANMKLMTQPKIYAMELEDHPMYYALGWVHMAHSPYPIIWHDGATLGIYDVAAFIPEEKLGIVVLSNVRNTRLSLALALQFFDLYYGRNSKNWSQQFLAEAQKTKKIVSAPAAPFPAMPLSHYTGTYSNPIYGNVFIKEDQKNLLLVIPSKVEHNIPLTHWDRDIFSLKWPNLEEPPSKVSFLLNEEGAVSKMDIEVFSEEGSGDFIKIISDHQ
ncbi:MAG: hypothetical protein CK425_04540 [Parachlamydia sp.]|nr:MAG: hypothetical protein CK425_04540 [Parachlamydia sp.]